MADPRTNLKVTIGGDIAEIKSALAQLRGEIGKTQKVADSGNYSRLTSGIKSFVGWLAGGITISAFASFAKNLIDMGDNLWTIHERTGVAVEDLSKFQGAAEQAGTSLEAVALGLNKLNKSIGLNDKNSQTMKQLGIDTTNATTAMLGLADVMQRTEDPALRTALAVQLFGKNGAELIPVLIQGRSGIEEMAGSMTTEFAQAADQFNDSMNDMKRNAQGFTSQGMLPVLQSINDVINAFGTIKQTGPEFAGFFNMITTAVRYTGVALNTLWKALQVVGVTIGGTMAKFDAALHGDFAAVKEIHAQQVADALALRKATIETNDRILNGAPATGGSTGPSTRRKGGGSDSYIPGSGGAADNAVRAALTTAKAVATARASVEDKADADRKDKADKEAKAIEDRNKRIVDGMANVNIELLRQTGQAADASFAEIDAKYANLLADLQAKGDSEGEATLRKLIGLEKADAVVQDLREKLQAAMDGLKSQTQFISNQVGIPGGITASNAETQLSTAREKTKSELVELRKLAFEAWNAAPTPETLALLNDYDAAIDDSKQSFGDLLALTTQDEGVQALEGFFNDLATGAKTFKDAFKDMVRSFVAGIAQMISAKLAEQAVEKIGSLVGAWHSGGIAGGAPTFRRSIDPAAFSAAPRYHTGGIAGLRANEVPAILLKGERVLSPSQTREYDRGSRPSPGTRIVNVFDPSFIPDQMDSAAGEKVILNVIGKNPQRIKQILA